MLSVQQIEERLNYITGTDAAIICGESKYCTPYQLWEYKTRRSVAPDISDKPAVKAGNMLEGAVRDWLSQELGKEIIESNDLIIHESYPWMAGNIDGRIKGDSSIVEIKTTQSDREWGESGTNIIPRNYLLQVIHYMAVTNARSCYVAVLIRGVDFRWYCIERDMELEKWLIEQEKAFWDCVKADVPPEMRNEADVVLSFSKHSSRYSLQADWDIIDSIAQYKRNKETLKQIEDMQEILKEKICFFMQDVSMLTGTNGELLCSWIKPKDTTRIDLKMLQLKYPDVYKQCLKTTDSSRRFSVK